MSTTPPEVTIGGAPAPQAFTDHINECHARYKALNGCPGCCSMFNYPHDPARCALPSSLRGPRPSEVP